MELESDVSFSNTQIENLKKIMKETEHEVKEAEMSRVGLEGEMNSLREEVSQLEEANSTLREDVLQHEVTNCDLRDQISTLKNENLEAQSTLEQKNQAYEILESHFVAQEEVMSENKKLVPKLED